MHTIITNITWDIIYIYISLAIYPIYPCQLSPLIHPIPSVSSNTRWLRMEKSVNYLEHVQQISDYFCKATLGRFRISKLIFLSFLIDLHQPQSRYWRIDREYPNQMVIRPIFFLRHGCFPIRKGNPENCWRSSTYVGGMMYTCVIMRVYILWIYVCIHVCLYSCILE